MRQRILGSHTPPCHRRMVITTQFSVLPCCTAAQTSSVPLQVAFDCALALAICTSRWLLIVLWPWPSVHLGQLAPTTLPQCRLVSNPRSACARGGGGSCTTREAAKQHTNVANQTPPAATATTVSTRRPRLVWLDTLPNTENRTNAKERGPSALFTAPALGLAPHPSCWRCTVVWRHGIAVGAITLICAALHCSGCQRAATGPATINPTLLGECLPGARPARYF